MVDLLELSAVLALVAPNVNPLVVAVEAARAEVDGEAP